MKQHLTIGKSIKYGWQQTNQAFGKRLKVILLSGLLLFLAWLLQVAVAPWTQKGTLDMGQFGSPELLSTLATERAERMEAELESFDAEELSDLNEEELARLQELVDREMAREYAFMSLGFAYNKQNIGATILSYLIEYIIFTFVMLGVISCVLYVVKGREWGLRTYFTHRDRFGALFLGYVLYTIGVVIGTILFIIPGVILSVRWNFYNYLIIDKKMGPIEALQESWKLTRGHFWQLLGLLVLVALIVGVGALLFGVGLLWAVPTATLAVAYFYQGLQGNNPTEIDALGEEDFQGEV